jgi:hypothetical protein
VSRHSHQLTQLHHPTIQCTVYLQPTSINMVVVHCTNVPHICSCARTFYLQSNSIYFAVVHAILLQYHSNIHIFGLSFSCCMSLSGLFVPMHNTVELHLRQVAPSCLTAAAAGGGNRCQLHTTVAVDGDSHFSFAQERERGRRGLEREREREREAGES